MGSVERTPEGWYVVGDQAYTEQEWQQRQKDRERSRSRSGYMREWRDRNREHLREYNRAWMRRARRDDPSRQWKRSDFEKAADEGRAYRVQGSLHDLRCTGPTRATGCRCKKITVLRQIERAA